MNPKILLTHPGTQHARHLAKQLYKNGLLYKFHTGIGLGENSWQRKMVDGMPSNIRNKISNRIIYGVSSTHVRQHILLELYSLWLLKNGKNSQNVFLKRNERFQNSISDRSIINSDVVIGFDTSSWILAKRCAALKKPFILDVSTPHSLEKKPILHRILQQYPEWEPLVEQKSSKLIEFELLELELATKIVVASSFSKMSLVNNGIPSEKIYVNPYGVDLRAFKPSEKCDDQPIHFVFVGLVDAKKGIPVLIEAWKKIRTTNTKLTFIGPINKQIEHLIKLEAPDIIIMGRVPYDKLPQILSDKDVLVFPSYFEGFALVIPESMASGLTIISTPATCAPDVIDDGINGFIIPCGDAESLAQKMQILIADRIKLREMQQAALKQVQNFTWDAYGIRWKKILTNL